MALISHTDRTLKEHLESCFSIAMKLLQWKDIHTKFYPKNVIEEYLKLLVFFHDLGKATNFFQHRIINALDKESSFYKLYVDYINQFKSENKEAEKQLNQNHKLSYHAALGAYWLHSNLNSDDLIVPLILHHIIKKHHANLEDLELDTFAINDYNQEYYNTMVDNLNFPLFNQILTQQNYTIKIDDWEAINSQFNRLRSLRKKLNSIEKNTDLKYFFLQHFLFSLLLSADKGDVMIDEKNILQINQKFPSNIIGKYKEHKFKDNTPKPIDLIREEAYQNISKNIIQYTNENFFSITLPTGMGKTFSAYNAAIQLQNKISKSNYRIIYCLPFTSIIDQNEQILSEIFEHANIPNSLIAKNHYLAPLKSEYDENQLSYQESEYLTEGWEQEFIVTTFVQLLESIFNNKNKRLRKFHNMTNAIILLDEVQNIPPDYYPLIEQTFKAMAFYFNTKFIFITATQPIIFSKAEDIIELTDPTKILTQKYFTDLARIELNKELLEQGEIDVNQLFEIIIKDIEDHPQKSMLIICNTIKHSQKLFNLIDKENDIEKFYLSSSILPLFRKEIIQQIQENTKKNTRQIIVSTQVVEAGVDIDLDIVYRDMAPLDSINQSAGRCNRNAINSKGIVKLFNSGKANLIYDTVLLNITQIVLAGYPSIIPENKLYEINTKYFEQVKAKIQDDNDVSNKLIGYMQQLKLTSLAEEFKLIKQNTFSYNIFIAVDEKAAKIWSKYLSYFKEDDLFKRKRLIKKIKPQLLQYVTRFPKYDFNPSPNQKDKAIIYLGTNEWNEYYDLKTGYKFNQAPTLAQF